MPEVYQVDLEFRGDSLGNGIRDYISPEFDGERCRYLPELWVTQDKAATINDCVNQRLSAARVDTCKQLSRRKKKTFQN